MGTKNIQNTVHDEDTLEQTLQEIREAAWKAFKKIDDANPALVDDTIEIKVSIEWSEV